MGPLIVISSLLCYQSYAATASAISRPVGSIKIDLLAETDTILAVPFLRYSELTLEIASVSGNEWTLGNGVVSPSMTVDKYALKYFAHLSSGPLKGRFYEIGSNSATSITIDPAGETLSSAQLIGQRVKIYPFWTIESLFGSLKTFNPASFVSGIDAKLEILVFDVTEGINLASSRSYYYYSGASQGGSGWREFGGGLDVFADDTIMDHQSFIVVRNRSLDVPDFVISGEVSTTSFVTPLLRLNETSAQDNLVSFVSPVPVTLAESNLYQSGAFKPSTFLSGLNGDDLILYDPAETGFNKAAPINYFYYGGSGPGGPGWRKVGDGANIDEVQDDVAAFKPGLGFIIRKEHDGTISEDTWVFTPPYENEYN